MKVKNIVFSGFMAMVLAGACGAANAEIIVASQKYVDTKVTSLNTKDTELSGKITALENANADGGSVANAIAEAKQVGTNAQGAVDALAEKMDLTSADSDLSQALATKEDTKNKITTTDATYFTNGKMAEGALTEMASDNTNFPTIATAVEIADAKAQDVLTKVNANAGNLSTITANVEKLMGADTVAGSVAYQVKQEETRAMAAEQKIATYDAGGNLTGGSVKDNADAIATLNGDENKEGSVAAAVKAEELRATAAEAQTLTDAKAYTDSRIGDLGNRPGTEDPYDNVKDYVDTVLDDVESTVGSANEALEAITKDGGTIDTKVLALENKLMDVTDGTVTAAIKVEADRAKLAEQANADAITTLTNGAVKDNADAIAAINDGTTGILATAKAYTNTEMEKFYANAQTCITNSDSKNCIMSAKLDGENNVQYVWISLTSPAE